MRRRPSTTVYRKRAGRKPGFPVSETRIGFRSGMSGLKRTDAESVFCCGAIVAGRGKYVDRSHDHVSGRVGEVISAVLPRARFNMSSTRAIAGVDAECVLGDYSVSEEFVAFKADSCRSCIPAESVPIEVCFSLRSIPPGLRNSQGGTNLNPVAKSVRTSVAMGRRLSRMNGSAIGRNRAIPAGKISDPKLVLRSEVILQRNRTRR